MTLVRKIALGAAAIATAGGTGYMMQSRGGVQSMQMFLPAASVQQEPVAPATGGTADPQAMQVQADASGGGAAVASPDGTAKEIQLVSASLPQPMDAAAGAQPTADTQTAAGPASTLSPSMPNAAMTEVQPASLTLPDASSTVSRSLQNAALITPEDDRLDAAPKLGAPGQTAPQDAACAPEVSATAGAAAMVQLVIAAPCHANDRVAVLHQGLVFTEVTDANGDLLISIPALSENAGFFVTFSDDTSVMAAAEVPSVEFYDRTILQWKGGAGFALHALEFGADYDQDGHVWFGSDRTFSVPATGEGGLVTRLGNPEAPEPMMADVYTFPTATATRNGEVLINVEAEVTDSNCDRTVNASVLSVERGVMTNSHDVQVTVPDCDSTGEYLVLKKVVNDLKIARN